MTLTITDAVLRGPMPSEVRFCAHTRRLCLPSRSSRTVLVRSPHRASPLGSCSSFALCSVVEDDLSQPPSSDALTVQAEEIEDVPQSRTQAQSGCKTCGRDEVENGCNGEGRIQGGIATIPGFGWWPIKAYRPCPGFLASGGNYRRRGQSMDEVAFGSGERRSSSETVSSKKKQGAVKFKR